MIQIKNKSVNLIKEHSNIFLQIGTIDLLNNNDSPIYLTVINNEMAIKANEIY